MLYSIFLYQSKSGILLWDWNFDKTSDQKADLFSSFFAAIKTFVRELITKGDDELKNIELGEHLIILFTTKEIGVDLVFISNVEDEKIIKKVAPKVMEILKAHKEVFKDLSTGDVRKFSILTQPILQTLTQQKGLIDQNKSLLDEEGIFLKQLFAKRGKLEPTEEVPLLGEQERLEKVLVVTQNLFLRHEILDELIDIHTKLGNAEDFLSTTKEERKTVQEILDLHVRLNYWLKQTKEQLRKAIDQIAYTQKSLQEGDYKDVFRNLLDFASNIKKIADEKVASRFHELARQFMEKDHIPHETFSKTIQEIINLKDDAFEIAQELGIPTLAAHPHQ